MPQSPVDPRIAIARTIMFVRNTDDPASHIAFSWTGQAMCGAQPTMRAIGWTLGLLARTPDHPLCDGCRSAYADWMGTER